MAGALGLLLVAILLVSNLVQWWVITDYRERIQQLEDGPTPGEWTTYKWYVDELRARDIERRGGSDEPREDDPGSAGGNP